MAKLFLSRHIKSVWNTENRFTGWVDVPLDKHEFGRAKQLAEKIFCHRIDTIYSSNLFRNEDTIERILEHVGDKYPIFIPLDRGKMKQWEKYVDISKNDVPVFVTERLNERYYGKLQGENKEGVMKKFGKNVVRLWRRSYEVAPPGGESLHDVETRIMPFFRKYVERDLRTNKNVLVVGSHNPLRAIVRYLEKIPPADIINLEIPYGGLIEYDLDTLLRVVKKHVY